MAWQEWEVDVQGTPYSVSIEISPLDGKQTVRVNGEVVSQPIWFAVGMPGTLQSATKQHHFEVAGKPAVLVCTNVIPRSGVWECELFVDGQRI